MSSRKERSQPETRPVPETDPNSELSRKGLLGRAAALAGAAVAVGLPGSARAQPSSGEGVWWNAAEGRFDAAFVTTSPATAADNTIQPTADVAGLTLRQFAGGTSGLLDLQNAAGDGIGGFATGNPFLTGNGRFELRDVGSGHGPHTWTHSLATHNGTQDPTSYIGYNCMTGGVPVVSGEPYCVLAIEGDYNDGSSRTMEWYAEAQNIAGTKQVRPFFAGFLRSATTKEALLNRTNIAGGTNGIVFSWLRDAGNADMVIMTPNNLRIEPPDPSADTVFQLTAAASRASIFAFGADATDSVFRIQSIAPTQTHLRIGPDSRDAMRLYSVSGGTAICMGGHDDTAALTVITTPNTGTKTIVGRAISSQSVSIFEAQSSAGAAGVLWRIDENGNMVMTDARNIILDTTTGTKIGTGTAQKLGFFDATPVVQRPSHGPQTAGSGYGSRERNMLNDVYSGLRALGLLA